MLGTSLAQSRRETSRTSSDALERFRTSTSRADMHLLSITIITVLRRQSKVWTTQDFSEARELWLSTRSSQAEESEEVAEAEAPLPTTSVSSVKDTVTGQRTALREEEEAVEEAGQETEIEI